MVLVEFYLEKRFRREKTTWNDDEGAVGDGALVHVALPLGALRRGHAVQLLHVRRETPGPPKEAEKTKNNSK